MVAAAAAAKSLQSCPTLCDPIDGSPPDWTLNVVGNLSLIYSHFFLEQPILSVLHSNKAWQEGSPKHSEKDAETHFMPQILPWTN